MISIVLPTYNGEKYIKYAIEGILSQSFTDWELIIIDDSSTDGTPNAIHEYAERDKRIKVMHNPDNLGLPASLNRGFENAQGEYLTWTSDDNYYLPCALEKMHNYMKSNLEVPMVCANMYIKKGGDEKLVEFRKYDAVKMYVDNYVGACFLYRREVLDSIGEYDTELFCVEDYDYWLRILRVYGRIGHLDEYLYVYRMHEKSLTSTKAEIIKKKHSYLLIRDLDWVLDSVKDCDECLGRVVDHLIESGDLSTDVKNRIARYLPAVNGIEFDNSKEKLILYGAGKMCDRALNEISHDKIAYIADGNPSRYSGCKGELSIISIEQLADIYVDYNVVITVGSNYMLDVMRDLIKMGVNRFYPYNLYSKIQKKGEN